MYYCDKCGRPATNLMWVEINGERMEEHLCSECAELQKGTEDLFQPLIGEFFDFPIGFARKKPSKRNLICPNCGMTSREFLETGRYNCPECYATFADIKPLKSNFDDIPMPIEKIKLNIKKPSELSYVDTLKQQLQKAVNEERYSDAADLKKKIDEIEKSKEDK